VLKRAVNVRLRARKSHKGAQFDGLLHKESKDLANLPLKLKSGKNRANRAGSHRFDSRHLNNRSNA